MSAPIPATQQPVADKAGTINPSWYRFLRDLWTRTGGSSEAPLYDTCSVPALSMAVPATGAPTLATITGNVKSWGFASGNALHFTVQLPERCRNGSGLVLAVHWAPAAAGSGDVSWSVEYALASAGATLGTTTATATAAATGALIHTKTSLAEIDGGAPGAVLVGRISRSAASYAGTALLLSISVSFVVDGLGAINRS